jgi:hypothetical protein
MCPEGAIRERRKAKVAVLKKQTSHEQEADIEQSLWAQQQQQQEETMMLAALQVQAMWGAAAAEVHAALGAFLAPNAQPLALPSPPSPPKPSSPMSVPVRAEVWDDSPIDSRLPSKGSALHALGNCRPCAWLWKPSGCQNGKDCGHCHTCPPGELKERKRIKAARRADMASSAPSVRSGCAVSDVPIIERLAHPAKIDSALLG